MSHYRRAVPRQSLRAWSHLALLAAFFLCAIARTQAQGNIYQWGAREANPDGLPTVVSTIANGIGISGSEGHTLAVRADGAVFAWGSNSFGQLGDNTIIDKPAPVQVKGLNGSGVLTNVITVAAGAFHSLAIRTDGTVWTWGDNTWGQLGDGGFTERSTPAPITLPAPAVAVAAGYGHSLVILDDGSVYAFGNNDAGQLGIGELTAPQATPVPVPGLSNAWKVACGAQHSLALRLDGKAFAWGANLVGELGDNTGLDSPAPVEVLLPAPAIAIAAGQELFGGHSLAVLNNGSVWAWGNNDLQQLGTSDPNIPFALLPIPVSGLSNAISVAAGGKHSLAVSNGLIYTWGDNSLGQLGDGTTTSRATPGVVSGLGGVAEVAANYNDSFALAPQGNSVSGTITLSGATSSAGQLVWLTIRPRNGGVPFTRYVVLGANGAYTLAGLQPLQYDIAIQGRKWLRKTLLNVNLTGGSVAGQSATLLAGDLNGDNTVDLFDLVILFDGYGLTPEDAGWNELADLNLDGIVDLLDLVVLFNSYGEVGDD